MREGPTFAEDQGQAENEDAKHECKIENDRVQRYLPAKEGSMDQL